MSEAGSERPIHEDRVCVLHCPPKPVLRTRNGCHVGGGVSVAKDSFSKLNLLFLRPKGENMEVKIQSSISSKNIHLKDSGMVKVRKSNQRHVIT